MTDMQTSLPLLIVRPSILNLVINFSTHLWPMKWKCPRLYLCLAHSTPSPPTLMQHMYQPYHKWYDPLHIITWPYWFIDLDLTCSSLLPRSFGAKPSQLVLHPSNRSIKPSLILIFSTLVTWLYVMSHMQWAPSWHHHLWTNLLCISHNHILVHLNCHSITKTKQGPFSLLGPLIKTYPWI
jgi:hypothetical protein